MDGRCVKLLSALICVFMVVSLSSPNAIALDLASGQDGGSSETMNGPPYLQNPWTSPDMGEDIYIVETSRGSLLRPYHTVAGTTNKLQLFTDNIPPLGDPIWSKDLQLGGLMKEESLYGEKIEWNSVDISVDPVMVVAGLRNSNVKLFNANGDDVWDGWTKPRQCGNGKIRAVAITPNADLIFAGSDIGPSPSTKPYLCAFHQSGNEVFWGEVTVPSVGYKITDIDISENGRFIAVTLAGPSSLVLMYDFTDVGDYIGIKCDLKFQSQSQTAQQGQKIAYDFDVFNEGDFIERIVLSRTFDFADPTGWTAEFEREGDLFRGEGGQVTLSPGESAHYSLWVGIPLGADPGESPYEITVHAEADGDPLKTPHLTYKTTWTTVTSRFRGSGNNMPPEAFIDNISNPTPIVGELVNFSGHGEDHDGFITSYRWTSTLDGVLSFGPTNSSFVTAGLSIGVHTIYFDVLDDEAMWSRVARASVIVKSLQNPFPTERFSEEKTDHTAGIAEISRDGRVLATGSLNWMKWKWSSEEVDPISSAIGETSIVLDSKGYPHIIYYDDIPNFELRYTWWDGTKWNYDIVPDSNEVGLYNSASIDKNDHLHISYDDNTNGWLKYAKWDGNSWQIDEVDKSGTVGEGNSIALDSLGNPHISYDDTSDPHSSKVKYVWFDGEDWTSPELVPDPGNVGGVTSIAIDSYDVPHIAYEAPIGLRYAKKLGPSSWDLDIVDPNTAVPHPSMDIGKDDVPRMSYVRGPDLYYAEWIGPDSWDLTPVDEAPPGQFVGGWNSLALDSNGVPHISYGDTTNDDLKYAKWTGTEWRTETVETPNWVGMSSSIAVDAEYIPHISHFDNTNDILKYTRLLEDPQDVITKVATYYTTNDHWSDPADQSPKWSFNSFSQETEITTISLSEWGSYIYTGTYDIDSAEVFVFNKVSGLTVIWQMTDTRIWSSDLDGVLGIGIRDALGGYLVLGTNGDKDAYTVYYYVTGESPFGSFVYNLEWAVAAGENVAAVSASSTEDGRWVLGLPYVRTCFIGDRYGDTAHVYFYMMVAP